MPKINNKILLQDLKKNNLDDNLLNNLNSVRENTNALSSFKNDVKKKFDWQKAMPPMTCNPNLVQKFRQEAKSKDWKYTTLMNKILEERYGKENNKYEDD
ncbi:MAG: hypothetical protein SPLM_10270 [Spiroplasma phoeniceum]|uniref:hypothetical protein n=1 Tax=Spiroplasma phoeniceum TaxID=47835 RepID=UPI0031340FAE